MTHPERTTIAALAKLEAMQAILESLSPSRLEDDSLQMDIGIPLRKWIERLEERLAKGIR